MKKHLLSTQEVEAFFTANAPVREAMTELIRHSIAVKQTAFPKDAFRIQYELLVLHQLTTRESEKSFQIDFDTLEGGYILAIIAEEILAKKVPVDPMEVLAFSAAFGLQIKQPNPRHWWAGDMEFQLQSYLLVWLHQMHGVDVTTFIFGITEDTKEALTETRSVDTNYRNIFPYLSDSIESCFTTISDLLIGERTKDTALDALFCLGRKNPVKGADLLIYGKGQHAENLAEFLPRFLVGLFRHNEALYLQECKNLFALNAIQGLHALTWLEYSNSETLESAYNFLEIQTIDRVEYLRDLPTFYVRVIENESASETIIAGCFEKLRHFTTYEDEALRQNLLGRTGMIEHHDKEKNALLPYFMKWGKPYVLRDYFDRFDSPRYLFDLIKQAYAVNGIRADIGLFRDGLHTQYMLHRELFNEQLLQLLTHDYAIIRFAGLQVMSSAHNQPYQVDFLSLDETQQIRVIETVLPTPMSIEELLPLVITLRNSPYPAVVLKLKEELCELVHAFDHSLIDLTDLYLDPAEAVDKELIDAIAAAYGVYKNEKELRLATLELNPVENELEYLEIYSRLEAEQQAQLMEQAQSKSFLNLLSKNIIVLRGSGYNSEINPGVSVLGGIEFSRLIDQRYSINPDQYEMDYKMNATTKNYTKAAK